MRGDAELSQKLTWGRPVQNKQDWARLHGHELHLMAASTDVRIRPGAWQKVALLRQVGAAQACAASWHCIRVHHLHAAAACLSNATDTASRGCVQC